MRFILVTLFYLASPIAVQATSFVTVVKTVILDRPVSGVDVSAPVLKNEPTFEPANIGRRDEDDPPDEPEMITRWITEPYTTSFVFPKTPKSTTSPESTDTSDDESSVEATETPTPEELPQDVTITLTESDTPDYRVRNTGATTMHPKPASIFTAIPDDWPPTVGPGGDPMIEPPKLPEIVNPGWVSPPVKSTSTPPYCEVYPLPDDDPRCQTSDAGDDDAIVARTVEKRAAFVTPGWVSPPAKTTSTPPYCEVYPLPSDDLRCSTSDMDGAAATPVVARTVEKRAASVTSGMI
jgi:hypothetical protein